MKIDEQMKLPDRMRELAAVDEIEGDVLWASTLREGAERLEKAEELLQGARDYINAPEGLDAAVKIVRNIDAFLNHASNTPRGG